jgi:hypothetical protein
LDLEFASDEPGEALTGKQATSSQPDSTGSYGSNDPERRAVDRFKIIRFKIII